MPGASLADLDIDVTVHLGWGTGSENAAKCLQSHRQVAGADCAESDQEALLGWACIEAVMQAECDDAVFGSGFQNLVLREPFLEKGGDVKSGVGGESCQL